MTTGRHYVLGTPLDLEGTGLSTLIVGMGCFWGAEIQFWTLEGVLSTAVGYAGGHTKHPSYEEVCSGTTGHAEVVRVAYDPKVVSLDELLEVFWKGHDPTQGMRQGVDVGTQYRSVIIVPDEAQAEQARRSRDAYQQALTSEGRGSITTEITVAEPFYFAEAYHQQYFAKNSGGYCGTGAVKR